MSSYSEISEMLAMVHVSPSEVQGNGQLPTAPRARWWRRTRPAYDSPFEAARAAARDRQVAMMRGPGGASDPGVRPGS
jgi:hypothetical protein